MLQLVPSKLLLPRRQPLCGNSCMTIYFERCFRNLTFSQYFSVFCHQRQRAKKVSSSATLMIWVPEGAVRALEAGGPVSRLLRLSPCMRRVLGTLEPCLQLCLPSSATLSLTLYHFVPHFVSHLAFSFVSHFVSHFISRFVSHFVSICLSHFVPRFVFQFQFVSLFVTHFVFHFVCHFSLTLSPNLSPCL